MANNVKFCVYMKCHSLKKKNYIIKFTCFLNGTVCSLPFLQISINFKLQLKFQRNEGVLITNAIRTKWPQFWSRKKHPSHVHFTENISHSESKLIHKPWYSIALIWCDLFIFAFHCVASLLHPHSFYYVFRILYKFCFFFLLIATPHFYSSTHSVDYIVFVKWFETFKMGLSHLLALLLLHTISIDSNRRCYPFTHVLIVHHSLFPLLFLTLFRKSRNDKSFSAKQLSANNFCLFVCLLVDDDSCSQMPMSALSWARARTPNCEHIHLTSYRNQFVCEKCEIPFGIKFSIFEEPKTGNKLLHISTCFTYSVAVK